MEHKEPIIFIEIYGSPRGGMSLTPMQMEEELLGIKRVRCVHCGYTFKLIKDLINEPKFHCPKCGGYPFL